MGVGSYLGREDWELLENEIAQFTLSDFGGRTPANAA
jgi:hypothetical protein